MRIPSRAPKIAIVLLVAVPVALALWVGASAAFMPGCAGCHLEGAFGEQSAASAHADVACSSCHGGTTALTRLDWGLNQVFGMYLPLIDADPTLSSVSRARCVSCHEAALAGISEAGGLRVKHESCAQANECTDCHGATAHGSALAWPRTASMELCLDCHAAVQGPTGCDSCHRGRLAADRIKTGTFAVTHGPNYQTTHGLGRMTTCGPCHDESKCAGCHGAGVPHGGRFVQRHSDIALREDATCEACHTQEFCSNCHSIEMPHPPSFTPEHATIVKRDGDTLCKTCHAPEDCVRCHEMHVHPVTLEQLRGLGVIPPDGGE